MFPSLGRGHCYTVFTSQDLCTAHRSLISAQFAPTCRIATTKSANLQTPTNVRIASLSHPITNASLVPRILNKISSKCDSASGPATFFSVPPSDRRRRYDFGRHLSPRALLIRSGRQAAPEIGAFWGRPSFFCAFVTSGLSSQNRISGNDTK
jgi:hypothetical protein